LARAECLAAMPAGHAHNDRWRSRRDKPDPVSKKNLTHVELLGGAFGYDPHLVFGHRPMRFIIDAGNNASVLEGADVSPKNDNGAGLEVLGRRRQLERLLGD
jgi:hypothetical protein